jgi:hypothetical protein
VFLRSRFRIAVAIVALAACGQTPREASRPKVVATPPAPVETGHLQELEKPAPAKLLAIDWAKLEINSDADALALWQRIAPTGADYSDKLDEIPDGKITESLAQALLRSGNFTCVKPQPPRDCAHVVIDVPEPVPDATLADPCLRRVLAMWSITRLEDADLSGVRDALRAIVAIPAPESELTAVALKALPETDHVGRLELFAIAFRAGHRELVNGLLGTLDDVHLVEAIQKHHIDGAFDLLGAESNRAVFLAALTDEQLPANARVQAISEIINADDKVEKDVHAALVRATRSKDCAVAAGAARFLVRNGDKKFAPGKPRTAKPAAMMRALCVLASYESGLHADEPTFVLGYVPKRGLELITTTYDEYNEIDSDGDGDPHTERTTMLVPRDEVALPQLEDMVRGFGNCAGTICRSPEHEFRFVFKGADLLLTRLEVIERPPCNKRPP